MKINWNKSYHYTPDGKAPIPERERPLIIAHLIRDNEIRSAREKMEWEKTVWQKLESEIFQRLEINNPLDRAPIQGYHNYAHRQIIIESSGNNWRYNSRWTTVAMEGRVRAWWKRKTKYSMPTDDPLIQEYIDAKCLIYQIKEDIRNAKSLV